MGELRRVSGKEAVRALERLGFFKARQRGSHVVMKKRTDQGDIGCVVPMHKDLALGTRNANDRVPMLYPISLYPRPTASHLPTPRFQFVEG